MHKGSQTTLGILAALILAPPAFADTRQEAPPASRQTDRTTGKTPSKQTIEYRNARYGFSFTLPGSWEGFSILQQTWQGENGSSIVPERGPESTIRNPRWAADNPWQDIPIMVFTRVQWTAVADEKISVSAAPVPPSLLGHNRKYVFALPARFNYGDAAGQQEVQEILSQYALRAF
jgi:hypothetical protein